MEKPKKVLLLGSGALKIGEAGEFDYSGSQAIKALKEEDIEVVLVNPNIATIQTSENLADKVYFVPVNPYFVEKVIEKEKPDGILLSFGGQTALNCGVVLHEKGVFEKYNVKVLGTPINAIIDTEDRDLFVKRLAEKGLKTPKSIAATSAKSGMEAAEKIGYPVMVRIAYALGGLGSGVAANKEKLSELLDKAFSFSTQVLIEEYLYGWKELEYEVVRDSRDNCIVVCNMENIDPMGIHTGESIVVAPSQTLTNNDYHMLRQVSIETIRHLGIVGECNIQFALHPKSDEYKIIEVNARLSRSSALASKATGYPLAFVAAKLALGFSLSEIKNSVTKVTTACFEPALDYIVIKIPRWDLNKFRRVSKKIGSSMKSVGEVMSIARSFEEGIQKAVRMLGIGVNGIVLNNGRALIDDVEEELVRPTDMRMFAIAEAFKQGYSVDRVHELSKIDKWFLHKINRIVELEIKMLKYNQHNNLHNKNNDSNDTGESVSVADEILQDFPSDLLLEAKKNGFSDLQIALGISCSQEAVRNKRKSLGIIPYVKQIDTLAAEYPAKTNYLYLTYHGQEHDIDFNNTNSTNSVIVLGGGAYRIGSSVEFDWCCVNASNTLRTLKYQSIMINCNPETVSTDYDESDRLYFEDLSFETVMDIYEYENPFGIIVSMGGQTPNNLALQLHKTGVRILGTKPENIDNAEDRYKFSKLLDSLSIDQPEWEELSTIEDAKKFSGNVKYPVLVRPSYVLSGAAMSIAFTDEDLEEYLKKAADVSPEHPVVISKFITNAKEIEIDAVAVSGDIIVSAITEHVENAGVHSGDATMVFPAQKLYLETTKRVRLIAKKLVTALNITGPFNIQFLAKENDIKVIELNLRASRSFPFVSKVSKINFIELATKAIVGKKLPKMPSTLDIDYVGVKAPQFSFSRLVGADPVITVEMASTGEVACLGYDLYEAFLKALISTGMAMPTKKAVLISISGDEQRYRFLEPAKILHELGFKIYATYATSKFLEEHEISNTFLHKIHEKDTTPNIREYIAKDKIDLVINVPEKYSKEELDDEYAIRRKAVDHGIPLFTNLQLAKLFVESIKRMNIDELEVKPWNEYN